MSYRFLLIGLLAACVDAASTTDDDEIDLASDDAVTTSSDSGAADGPSWELADTLHANARTHDYADANARRVHSLWIAGSTAAPLTLTITARANEGYNVRIAVLGPITAQGTRPVLGAAGYSAAKRDVSVTFSAKASGEHLVVVGSHNLATETFYELGATCTSASCGSRVDILATPKDFGLVGDAHGLVQMNLGDVMANRTDDLEVELWASRPMQWWNATKIATSYASGSQVNAILPSSVRAGDDIRLVVRQAGGRVLDTGVTTRYMPGTTSFARLDAILYGDIASLAIAGVTGFFEGHADMRLYSETRNLELAAHNIVADRPGMVGNGFGAFDATFLPDLSIAATNGELLSIGFINGNGDYRRLGCFEYCNDLSGLSSCTGGPRACP